ncbi:RHS repeat-associated core domain-containing protein [Amycolatopsis mediterranei]|uniref:RHS repeat-associated core domain-containing protein n=1 Tax=Amycolatopsis mediterranei TaxID=33910 RepID=UPI001EE65F48|nr:RHS repeat-associated core domain-containing protein [Amycolatopsis mediterranei]UZF72290.1 polymorphic toxin-type HINT domain-containing protein [Amycolatopsis mediterranei]
MRFARSRRALALGMAVVLLGSAQTAAAEAAAGGWHGLGWDLPPLQQTHSVDGVDGGFRAKPATPGGSSAPAKVSWPAAATADVDLAADTATAKAPAGQTVAVARSHAKATEAQHTPGKVRISTLDQAAAAKAGIKGVLVKVEPVFGDTSGPVNVDVDYRSFGDAYGGDFGGRLHLVQYPSCLLTTPDKPECHVGTPLSSENNAKTRHVAADVTLGQQQAATSMLVAAEADTKSGGGDFGATDLKPAGSWSAGGSSADFDYSYPIGMPAALGGTAPSVSLNYSSSSVDGLTSATNNQASGVGDGWSLSGGGFIERRYKGCSQDLGGNNGQTKTGDLCWFNDNATISFAGANGDLILDKNTQTWHPKDDDGTRVERLTGGANGDKFGEYWKVTTPDGVQYFFGLNHLPGWSSGKTETQSTWTAPVFGNNTNEPCNAATYAASWCNRAWRWNLDYVVDPHGNAIAYYYQPETNFYGLNRNASTANNPGTQYTRSGYLQRIEYGFNTKVADTFSHAPAQVLFDTAERCFPSGTITCDPGQLNSGTATSWPDVPSETICAQGAVCVYNSPSFFSRKRYTKITTQVSDGGAGWKPVREWALAQSFPPTTDGNKTALWLDSVTETGRISSPNTVGSAITLPATTFHAKSMANRVDTSAQYTALTRNRIDAVTTPQGGLTTVKYADPECKPGGPMPDPANLKNNTLSCYPVYWNPPGATDPVLDYFTKFRVTDVIEDANTTQQPQPKVTHYDYLGGAAWHYDDDPFSDPKYRTWSQWRGYGDVKTTTGLGPAGGDPSGPPVTTETFYLRGMEGATVTSPNWHESVTDRQEVAGFTRETVTYRDGQVVGGSLTEPWVSNATATDADGRTAAYTDTDTTRTRTWLDTKSTWRVSRTHTTHGKYGLATAVQTQGDTSDPKQTSCTLTTYLENATAWLLNSSSQVQKISGVCDGTANPPGPGNIISDTRTYYDKQAFGAAPSEGNITQIDSLDDWPVGGAEKITSPAATTVYDKYGRAVSATDALGLTSTTAYTPAEGGPVTQVDTTTPPVTAAADAPKFTSTKYLDPVSGITVASKDASGLRTDATQDALGRVVSVWKPGHSKAANAPADVLYSYSVRNAGGVSNVTTQTLLANGQYATSYTLVDGLGRTVQTQAPRADDGPGRIITDTFYDSQGRTYKTHNAYWNSAAPSSTLYVTDDASVPNTTLATFDSAGSPRASAYLLHAVEQWRTTTIPDGDRTTTIPPAGGTASTTITNGLGQTVQLLQYKDPTKYTPGSPADTTTYAYTRSGKQATVTDTTGKNVWTFEYDLKDRKIASTDPDTGRTTFTYDAAGRLLTTTDARNRLISYTYDNLGRKTAEYDGPALTGTKIAGWTYDTLLPGQPTSSTRYVGTKAYTKETTGYDTAGRPTGSKVTIPPGDKGLSGSYQFGITYDPNSGAVHTMNTPEEGGLPAEEVSFAYYDNGAPKTMLAVNTSGDFTKLVSSTAYNPLGQVLRTNYNDDQSPYQVSVTSTYADGTNRLETVQAQRSTSSDYWIANRVYSYNQVGNLTKIADTPPGTKSDVQCFRQDYLQRLTEAWTPGSGDCAAQPTTAGTDGAAPYWTSWTFDDTGDRKTQVQHTPSGDITTASTYPAPGASRPHAVEAVTTTGSSGTTQTSYGYTKTGSTESRGPAGAAQTFTYDAEGRVATAKEANGADSSYLYDADGNLLITKDPSGTTLSVGDMELFVPTGATFASGTRFYSYNGQVIATRASSGGLSWKLSDHQGTTYATVDAGNLAVTKRWQDPYGTSRGTPPSTWPDKHGFVGGYQNTTGLTHLGARDYDPLSGRFLTADPMLDTGNPQALNAYSYGNNSPISFSDPSGMMWGAECGPDGVLCGTGEAMSDPNYVDNRAFFMKQRGYSQQSIDSFRHIAANSGCKRGSACSKQREVVRGHVKKYSPITNDPQRLISLWSSLAMQIDGPRPFWNTATGTGDEMACYGQRGCHEAWIYLQGHGDDVAGAKVIAALYCVEHFEECEGEKQFNDMVMDDLSSLLLLGAMGLGSAAGAAAGETAAGEGAAGAAAGDGAAERAAFGCNSFPGSTPVLMADGSTKSIADIHVGEQIANMDPGKGDEEHHPVVAVHTTDTDREFVDVYLSTGHGFESVSTTAHHLFWDAARREWVPAVDLRSGDQVTTMGDAPVLVAGTYRHTGGDRTYNLSVDAVHTYYVEAGSTPVLVHNCGNGPIWTSTKKFNGPGNAFQHWKKHGSDFPGLQNAKQYVERATEFLRRPGPGVLTKIRSSGDVVRYDPNTQEFGVMTQDGIPRTYYVPDPATHGLPTNLDYFNAQ